jgi:hypothetical protein
MSPTPSPRALFLHSGFRSASTWFWHRFREAQGTCAYYEPFHEALATLRRDNLPVFASQHWASGHPELSAPYFDEYEPLLRSEGGVRFYLTRFAAEAYYETGADDAQARYIRNLADHARQAGKMPVFGFCRSLGRVPWFRALDEGLNIVTWRNPWDQWVSCRDQALSRQNWYFLFRFVLFASFGSRHLRFAPFFADLGLPAAPAGITKEQLSDLLAFFEAASTEALFPIFLRVYMLDMLIALHHGDLVVDLDALSEDAAYRRDVTAGLRDATGLADLSFEDCALPHRAGQEDASSAARLEEALRFLAGAGRAIAGEYPRALPLLERRLEDCLRRISLAVA